MRKSQDNHIGYLIHQIAHLILQQYNEKLEREGITASQERVLVLLYKHDGVTQSNLQQDLFIKPSSVTKLIDILERKGLVKRTNGGKDGRVKKISLTDKGKQLEESLWSIKEEMEAQLSQYIIEEQLASFIEQLKLVRKNLVDDH